MEAIICFEAIVEVLILSKGQRKIKPNDFVSERLRINEEESLNEKEVKCFVFKVLMQNFPEPKQREEDE